ncbi:hypothetical protein SEUCBS140593_004923 [Sporothrix eucalyptigena]|uniref:Carboxylic ester hydrolase n=1 Tax=Sporothrix eucalyptigena TaxID=1812306 RepID=A0ABP0BSZ2_9PEZI
MSNTLHHPLLGTVRGRVGVGVVQFLGLQYATLKDRLADPELKTTYGGETDATRLGPQVISSPTGCEDEFSLIQQTLPLDQPAFETSDRDGLVVNITAPDGAADLPVLVFLHGGGFRTGSNAWPQYDLARLVGLAAELGTPFVGVAASYRVGVPGFLTSKELQDAGYKPNNGLRDQRTALLWIQRFIHGFGGNPARVTLAGQSAGAVAAMLHLQSKEPLFDQLILLSGSSLLLPPVTADVSEAAYTRTVHALGLEGLSSVERTKALVEGPVTLLYEKITPDIPLLPVIDGDLVHSRPTFETFSQGPSTIKALLPGAAWCRRLFIGDCAFDASIYYDALEHRKAGLLDMFHKSLTTSLKDQRAVNVLEQTYGISLGVPDDTVVRNILRWATDIGFQASACTMAHNWPGPAFLYHINAPNPWDGLWQGEACHIMDVVLLFQNYNKQLPPEQQGLARQFAAAVAAFAAGEEPFSSHHEEPCGAMVYGPPAASSAFIVRDNAAAFGRRDGVAQLAKTCSLDAQMDAWNRFLAGQ